jgi:hypothetical protein
MRYLTLHAALSARVTHNWKASRIALYFCLHCNLPYSAGIQLSLWPTQRPSRFSAISQRTHRQVDFSSNCETAHW